jgi:glycosyltransferase involved in cell wall biosynthesis
MNAPRISVIVTALNFEGFILDAIRSIQAQDVPIEEILVVDAGSEDATAAILAGLAASDPRIRPLTATRHSPARSRNAGLAVARGEVIAMLDGDDTWPRGKLAAQLAALAEPGVSMVSGLTGFCDAIDAATQAPPPGARVETIAAVNIGACLYRAAAFAAIGGFDEGYRYADDWDVLLRLRDAGLRDVALPEVTLWHRRYPGSLLTTPDPHRKQELALVVARSLARRRSRGAA